IKNILEYLDIKILSENQLNWQLEVPAYRTDVQREADVVEEVLRIYGYNNIEFPDKLQSSLSYFSKPNRHWLTNLLSTKLTALGFFEVMNNSMTSANYNVQYPLVNSKNIITLENPLSSELQIMRPTLVFQLLENIAFNQNRREL